jgi:hypothetical protein
MSEQSYAQHAHHPKPTYVAFLLALAALILIVVQMLSGWATRDWAVLALVGSVVTLTAISRWYIVALQDRIIMLEMKVRAAEVLPAGQETRLAKLSTKQVVALRFAPDDELSSVLERAVRENLSPKDIKASIRTWRPDPHRT